MKSTAWESFVKTRERYRDEIARLQKSLPGLQAVVQKLVDGHSPSYRVETPAVYNSALDDINPDSKISMILVGDNPGRREQAAENRRYLVGPSGKIAEKFFSGNPSLGMDFRKNVIILNKTPIHTPRTAQLKDICRFGGKELETAIAQSQRFMAGILADFQQALCIGGKPVPIWITGYSEMKKGGVFEVYTNELKNIYGPQGEKAAFGNTLFLYRHFSMNQFTIDLKKQTLPGESITETLARIGKAYRQRFLF